MQIVLWVLIGKNVLCIAKQRKNPIIRKAAETVLHHFRNHIILLNLFFTVTARLSNNHSFGFSLPKTPQHEKAQNLLGLLPMHFYMLPGCRHLSRPHRRPYVEHYIALYIFIFLSFRCTAIQRNQKEEKYR